MAEQLVQEIRSFNRFYTGIIGLLDRHLLNTRFSLPEARVLYELFHGEPCTASNIMENMEIDKSYLSRILLKFTKQKLLLRVRSEADGRSVLLSLSATGRQEFRKLNEATNRQLKELLKLLSVSQQEELAVHLRSVRDLLEKIHGTVIKK